MIDEVQAREYAQAWLREHHAGAMADRVQLTEFVHGWLAHFPQREPIPQIGGIRLIVDKDDGSVHASPTNRSAEEAKREFSERKQRSP